MDYIVNLFYGLTSQPEHARWLFLGIVTVAVMLFFFGVMLLLSGTFTPLRRRIDSIVGDVDGDGQDNSSLSKAMAGLLPYIVPKKHEKISRVRARLNWAGYYSRAAISNFYAIKLLLAIVLLAGAIVGAAFYTGQTKQQIYTLALIASILGWMLPNLVLSRQIKKRRRKLINAIPDALDLLVTCTEAGLGLNAAFQRVAAELSISYPELAQELSFVNAEIRAGVERVDALRHLADRTGLEDIRGLVSLLAQTLRFGTSVAEALRVYSDEFRDKRLQRAEEQAAKMGTKLIFPLAFCLLPSMFMVGVGPAILGAIRALQGSGIG